MEIRQGLKIVLSECLHQFLVLVDGKTFIRITREAANLLPKIIGRNVPKLGISIGPDIPRLYRILHPQRREIGVVTVPGILIGGIGPEEEFVLFLPFDLVLHELNVAQTETVVSLIDRSAKAKVEGITQLLIRIGLVVYSRIELQIACIVIHQVNFLDASSMESAQSGIRAWIARCAVINFIAVTVHGIVPTGIPLRVG